MVFSVLQTHYPNNWVPNEQKFIGFSKGLIHVLVFYRCLVHLLQNGCLLDSGWTSTYHYNDAIMSATVSQITSLTIVDSSAYSGADQTKHQSSASLAFVWGIFSTQRASNAENISIRWRHHDEALNISVETMSTNDVAHIIARPFTIALKLVDMQVFHLLLALLRDLNQRYIFLNKCSVDEWICLVSSGYAFVGTHRKNVCYTHT